MQKPEFRERTRAYNRAYHAAHKDEINALRRLRWANNPERKEQHRRYRRKTRRKDTLKYYYGISPDDYDRLFAQQRGACAICRERPAKTLCIDHCHATGKVRGLLCRRCNLGLGHLDDSPTLVSAALAYLAGSRDAALAYLAGSRDYEQA
jgi:hypothetical protein